MGQANPNGPKQFGRLTEQDILVQSEHFITQQDLATPKDQIYNVLRSIIAKINLYGHRHLLDHIRNFHDKQTKLAIFKKWQKQDFAKLDLLFQHLIRKKIMKISEQQVFSDTNFVKKYDFRDVEKLKEYYTTGQQLMKQKKVAIIMFPGSSSTKSQEINAKQFFKQIPQDDSLFDIIVKKIEVLGKQYGFPPVYLFCTPTNIGKAKQQIKKYKHQDLVNIHLQQTHPVLNLNGNICLKNKDQADLVQMPKGSGNFARIKINGVSLLQILKNKGIEYVSCPDFENIFEYLIDPYMIGYLHLNKQKLDLVYKCALPEDSKQRLFRRCVIHNNQPKVDSMSGLSSYVNYNVKYRQENNKVMTAAPIWLNHLVFNLDVVYNALKQIDKTQEHPDAITYKMNYLTYWSPIDYQEHYHEACYAFQKQISDILVNTSFRSTPIMVDRMQEYFPIIAQSKKYCYKDAYKEYLQRQKTEPKIPFYENPKFFQKYKNYQSEQIQPPPVNIKQGQPIKQETNIKIQQINDTKINVQNQQIKVKEENIQKVETKIESNNQKVEIVSQKIEPNPVKQEKKQQ